MTPTQLKKMISESVRKALTEQYGNQKVDTKILKALNTEAFNLQRLTDIRTAAAFAGSQRDKTLEVTQDTWNEIQDCLNEIEQLAFRLEDQPS
jgi:hypothetical protein